MKALGENALFGRIPHLLCSWHVNMNVLAKTKKHFPPGIKQDQLIERHPDFEKFLQDWNNLIASPYIDSFDKNLHSFQDLHRHPTPAIRYALYTWITPWKEKIVAYWVDQAQHFCHRTTSTVESSHASIKASITSYAGELKNAFQKLSLYWYNQKATLDLVQAQGVLKRNTIIGIPFLPTCSMTAILRLHVFFFLEKNYAGCLKLKIRHRRYTVPAVSNTHMVCHAGINYGYGSIKQNH